MSKQENPQITIGNLTRQLHNATQRCQELMTARENADQRAEIVLRELDTERQYHKADVARLQDMQANYARLDAEFAGYRQAVADIMGE